MHRARLYQHYPGRETSGNGSAPLIDAEAKEGNTAAAVTPFTVDALDFVMPSIAIGRVGNCKPPRAHITAARAIDMVLAT